MKVKVDTFEPIISKPFFKSIIENGGEIFFIGGAIRDMFLEKEPKDIDLVCRLLSFEKLSNILLKYGRVDLVGESFGVIKFKEFETNWEAEIAITRTDVADKTKKGHTAIIAQSNENLPIEIDLKRRDFTINSIAISHNLLLIDPFDGLKDLKEKVIRATDENAFIDDPLRMIRALQFSSRFDFSIEPKTFMLIQQHAHLIKDISGERLLMEFQKVIDKKGDWIIFLDLLDTSGLWEQFFGFKMDRSFGAVRPTTIAELLLFTVRSSKKIKPLWSKFFEEKIRIDNKTQKELVALQNINITNTADPVFDFKNASAINRRLIFRLLHGCPWALELPYFELYGFENDFKSGRYPKSFKELAITGDELLAMGISQGKECGDMLRLIVNEIFEDRLNNELDDIKKFILKK